MNISNISYDRFTKKELLVRHGRAEKHNKVMGLMPVSFDDFIVKFYPSYAVELGINLSSGVESGHARKREMAASVIGTARPEIIASSGTQRPVSKIYVATEQHEQKPTVGLCSPLKSVSEISDSPAQTPQQKWRKKNKKKLADYQKEYRAKSK